MSQLIKISNQLTKILGIYVELADLTQTINFTHNTCSNKYL